MVSILSPGVYLIEKDISNYPPSIGTTTVGVVGYATKGPTDKATLVTSQDNLVDLFGYPTQTLPGHGVAGALELLEVTNSLYYVRVAAADALQASANVLIGTCPAFAVSSAGIGVTQDATFVVQVKDNTGKAAFPTAKTYYVKSGAAATQQEALAQVFGTDIDTLKVTAQFPYSYDANGNVVPENVSSTNPDHGFTTNTAGFIVGSFAGSGAEITVSAFSGEGTNVAYSGLLYPVSGASGIFSFSGNDTMPNGLPASGFGTAGGTIKGTTFTNFSYLVESLYPGAGYNLGFNDDKTVRGNSVEIDAYGGPQALLTVNEGGGTAETFRISLKDSEQFATDVINVSTDNAVSQYIQASFASGAGSSNVEVTPATSFVAPISDMVDFTPQVIGAGVAAATDATGVRFSKFVEGTYALDGGNNGSVAEENIAATVIGNSGDKTGIYALDDDILNLTLGIVPGLHDQDIQNALITLAETSTNFMAVVAPPLAKLSVQEAIDWSNGFSEERTSAINSSYAAIYWPHVQVFVPSYGKEVWLDPAIFGARQILYTAATSELWFAPAGFVRGRLTKPTDVEVRLGQGERDAMYSGGNAINPIVNFPQQGITIFGQRTAQRAATALDRVNVRLLAIYIKKLLLASVQSLTFEPNDPILWEEVAGLVNSVLAPIKAGRGLNAYAVKCDATTNTPLRQERGELWCKVTIQPTKTAEAIVFELNVASQSATIN